jgi:hypothetical protein
LAVFSAVVLFLISSTSLNAARPTAARLLPENTVAMVSVPDVKVLCEKFMNTNLGRMSQDPRMKPVIDQLYGSMGELVDQVKDNIGLSFAEIMALPQGEITAAMVAPQEGRPGGVLIFEAGDQIANARKLVERGKQFLQMTGSTKREETIAEVKCTIYQSPNKSEEESLIVLFEKDDAIAFCFGLETAKQVLAVWTEKKDARSLAENANYATIANRCRGTKDEEPQFIWYADPVGIMKSIAQSDLGMKFAVASLPALGLDGLSGVGGSAIFDTEQYNTMLHLHILLSSPRTGVIKIIAFEPGTAKPERWVPGDVASYATTNWNFETSLKAWEKVYDSFHVDGAFAQNMADFNRELETDFQKQIIPALDGRVTYINWIEKPIKLQSSHTLVALKLKDKEKAVETIQKVLDNIVKKDTQKTITTQTSAGKSYYRQNFTVPNMPEGAEPPPLPKPCFGIVEDYLMISNQPGVYEQVLATAADSSKSLANELDFKLVAGKLQRAAGGTKPALLSFDRPEESFRYVYELVTSDQTKTILQREAPRNPFFRTVNSSLEKQPLPPFSVLQKYLAPGGSIVVDDETGIHFMNFTLKRKAE